MNKKIIYLDNNATTKPNDSVLSEYIRLSKEEFYNINTGAFVASTLRDNVDKMSNDILEYAGLENGDYGVLFAGSATEINKAIIGLFGSKGTVITSPYEHKSISSCVEGMDCVRLPVDKKNGTVHLPDDWRDGGDRRYSGTFPGGSRGVLQSDVPETLGSSLVSVMAANNEFPVRNDLAAIAEKLHPGSSARDRFGGSLDPIVRLSMICTSNEFSNPESALIQNELFSCLEMFRSGLRPIDRLKKISLKGYSKGRQEEFANVIKALSRVSSPVFHTDATQLFGKVAKGYPWSADLISFSTHKFGGLKGVGVLIYRKSVLPNGDLPGLVHGTPNSTAILAHTPLFKAMAKGKMDYQDEHYLDLRCHLFEALVHNEIEFKSLEPRDFAFLNFGTCLLSFPGACNLLLKKNLDENGIIVSIGSACDTDKKGASDTVKSLGLLGNDGIIRISFGTETTTKELDFLAKIMKKIMPNSLK